jgi:hypothetical protein
LVEIEFAAEVKLRMLAVLLEKDWIVAKELGLRS